MASQTQQPQTKTMPQQQMMSYNVQPKNPSSNFPGLEEEEEKYITESIAKMGVSGVQKKAIEEDAYKTFMEAKQARAFLDDRAKTRKEVISGKVQLDKTQSDVISKKSLFADIIREDALSKGVKSVTAIDDDTLLERAFQQNPEASKMFEDYMNNKVTASDVTKIITGKGVDDEMEDDTEARKEWEQYKKENGSESNRYTKRYEGSNLLRQMWNVATGNYTDDDEAGFQDWKKEREKSWSDVAMKDIGATPSVIAGAISAPVKALATIGDLGGKLAGKDWKLNDGVDKLFDSVGVDRDGWFNAGKFAGEVGMSALAINKLTSVLNGVTKIGQIANLVNKVPKIAKYIAKPVLEGIGYQGISDLVKGELSSKGQYATSAVLSTVLTGLGDLRGMGKAAWKNPKKYFQEAGKNVDNKVMENIIKKTDDFVVNPKAINPLDQVQQKVDDVIQQVAGDKGAVGEKLGTMRTQMKTVDYSTDKIVNTLNKTLKENDIALEIVKTAKGYNASGKILSTEGKGTIMKDLVAEINALGKIGSKNNLRGLDKINQEMISFMKKQNIDGSLKNAFGKASGEFSKSIDDVMNSYGAAKGEYKKLIDLQTTAKELSSEAGEKGVSRLKRVFGPEGGADYKKFLEQVKELGYTTDDLLSETIVTNYIMASKLGKDMFTEAVDKFYPSIPGLYELGIKGIKSATVNPSKELLRYSKGFKQTKLDKVSDLGSKLIKPTIMREKTKIY